MPTYTGPRINKHIRPKSVLKLKSRQISFFRKTFNSCPKTLLFCTEHGSYTAVICTKYQSDWTTVGDFMEEHDFARFQFKTDFDHLRFIETGPWYRVGWLACGILLYLEDVTIKAKLTSFCFHQSVKI